MGPTSRAQVMGLVPLDGICRRHRDDDRDLSHYFYSAPRDAASSKEFSLCLICPNGNIAFGMATNSSSSTSDIIISSSSSSHQMETSHLPITTHKLNGQNYLQWSQSILMFIRGKEKDDYITGASAAPETTASTYKSG
ncbi:hypothetical protein CK203_061354 [Vitis vinifera]|uniref:Retrotransposon Copia-like N-terminal domain-containing protein n=1 Tax=Vitis vinifera TaxID=29760 RepID=A0A438GAN5_VITVI|nr:hypothetical protein CK203_061354 [Vitis vinifera]